MGASCACRLLGDVEYDGRTLFIPDWQWSKFTPFEKQFWEIKSKLFDTVVFFKKGSFYELYENDADIGAKEFNLKMVERVNMRMVGVPEGTFDFWAAKFVAKGHRVAKVDQLENAVSKTMREKSEKGKAEKIIRRELASVLTCGTLVDGNHLKTANFNFCLSLKVSDAARISEYRIGAAFVDASSAKFFVVDFEDDCTLVTLETFLAQIVPKEVIFEKVDAGAMTCDADDVVATHGALGEARQGTLPRRVNRVSGSDQGVLGRQQDGPRAGCARVLWK